MEQKTMRKQWAVEVNKQENRPYKDAEYGNKIKGKITAEHYIIYNVLRDLPKERGFEPLGEGYKGAVKRIESSFRFSRTDWLLMPFKDLITADELKELL